MHLTRDNRSGCLFGIGFVYLNVVKVDAHHYSVSDHSEIIFTVSKFLYSIRDRYFCTWFRIYKFKLVFFNIYSEFQVWKRFAKSLSSQQKICFDLSFSLKNTETKCCFYDRLISCIQ
jgi:hypothetical protein